MIYLFLGPPASGKGTQAELLAKEIHVPYVSVGALLRQASDNNEVIATAIQAGELIPDRYVLDLFAEIAERYPDALILDGAVRTTNQVDTILRLWPTNHCVVIAIDIPDEEIRRRAQKRTEDGHKRVDDSLTIVNQRIQDYRQSSQAIIAHLEHHHIPVLFIDGNHPIEQIHDTIIKEVSKVIV